MLLQETDPKPQIPPELVVPHPDLAVIAESASQQAKPKNDRLAQQEEDAKFNDGRRGENYRTHIHRIVCIGMYLVGAVVLAMIVVRSWHFLAPEHLHWLNVKENQDIERIIFGSILFSVLGKYFKKFKIVEEA